MFITIQAGYLPLVNMPLTVYTHVLQKQPQNLIWWNNILQYNHIRTYQTKIYQEFSLHL